jgi:hypothetical protein
MELPGAPATLGIVIDTLPCSHASAQSNQHLFRQPADGTQSVAVTGVQLCSNPAFIFLLVISGESPLWMVSQNQNPRDCIIAIELGCNEDQQTMFAVVASGSLPAASSNTVSQKNLQNPQLLLPHCGRAQ